MKQLLLLGLLTSTAQAQSIWWADFVQSKPGRQARTIRYFEQNWAKARQVAQSAGYIQSYRLLQVRPDTAKRRDYDIILLTEFPDEQTFAKAEENFAGILNQTPRTLPDAVPPVDLRDIRFSQTFTDPLPPAPTDPALEATLRDYLDGGTHGDTTRLIRAFHPSATMKYMDGATGQFNDVPIRDYLNRARANAGKRTERTTRIVRYDIAGTAAQARVEARYPTFRFIDYFNLLRIDGRWQIVSKIFYRQETDAAK